MDISLSVAAREAHQGLDGLPMPMPHKAARKHKKAVLFFEVEIRDAKTREKLCFLDKVEPQATISEIKTLFTKTRESPDTPIPAPDTPVPRFRHIYPHSCLPSGCDLGPHASACLFLIGL